MSTDVPKNIGPNAGTVTTSTLTIPDSMVIGNIEVVGLNITHTFASDLDVFLISPSGAIMVELFTDVCGSVPWTPGSANFTLSQAASNLIGSACPPGTGTYRPEGSLASLFGTNAQGTWTLQIIDDANVDQGVLYGWGLRIRSAGCPPKTPDPTFTPTITNTPTHTRTPTATRTVTITPTNSPTPGGACVINTYTSTDVPKNIGPNAGTVTTSTLTIPDSMIIGNIEVVGLNITHTFASDLDVFLISPSAAITVELFTDVCGSVPWTPGSANFTLSQAASNLIGSACPPGTGAYRPEGSLAALFGTQAQGTWTLQITDDANVDQGVLYGWGLRVRSAGCPPKTPDPTFSPTNTSTPSHTRTPTNTRTVTSTPGGVTATATRTPALNFSGSIAAGDPSHVNYVDIDSTASNCTADPCPGTFTDSSSYRYDTYSVTNTGGTTVCYTINVNGSACGGSSFGLWAFAYLNSYNPASLCTNYIGDAGSAAITGSRSFSVNIPAGQTLILEIEEYIAGTGCASYSGSVTQSAAGADASAGVKAASLASTGSNPKSVSKQVGAQVFNMVAYQGKDGTQLEGSAPENANVTVTFRNRPVTTGTVTPTSVPCDGWATICHRVGNGSYRTITINCHALPAHLAHGDIYPVPSGGCPLNAHPVYFDDVPEGHTFFYDISDLYEMGVISGYSDGTFRVGNTATRGHVAKMAVLAHGVAPLPESEQHFSDVPYGSTYFEYIEAAYAQGWLGGYSDGTFRPYENTTRGQIAKISVKASGVEMLVPENNQATFSDVPYGSAFYEYVETAYANGMISGYPDGTFRPNALATRGQLAKIIMMGTHP